MDGIEYERQVNKLIRGKNVQLYFHCSSTVHIFYTKCATNHMLYIDNEIQNVFPEENQN